MSKSTTESTSLLNHPRVGLGLGLFVVVVLGLVVAQIGTPEEPQRPPQVERQAAPPPVPQMTIEDVENKVIEQEALDYDASLRLSTAKSSK